MSDIYNMAIRAVVESAREAYDLAIERFRLASARERTCRQLHREGYLTDAEYLVAREALREADRAVDAAEKNLP